MTENITVDKFEQTLEEQRILKWRELEENKIYEVTHFYETETMYGNAWIIVLAGGNRIFALSALANLFEKKEDNIDPPFYIRPTGLKQSCKNKKHEYYSFDVVF